MSVVVCSDSRSESSRGVTGAGDRRGSDFAPLLRAVRLAGLLDRRPWSYAARVITTLAFYGGVWGVMVWIGDSWFQLIAATVLAVAFGQVAFLGHDAGHQAIFASRRWNDAAGRIFGSLVGLSFGWWVETHNRHHANPNDVARDPDIGDGVLAFTADQASRRGGALSRFVARRQAWLFFPLLTLQGISMHVDSVAAISSGKDRSTRGGTRWMEGLQLAMHLALYIAALLLIMSPEKAIAVAAVHQAVFGIYMGCSFAPNHKGMPFIEAGDRPDYLRRQVLTSRNVRGGWWTDLALGGLNYQIEHHLFPNMPRASLRRAQPIVRNHCRKIGLSYCEASFIGSYTAVVRHLNSIGAPLRAAHLMP